jgi:dolichol kinase
MVVFIHYFEKDIDIAFFYILLLGFAIFEWARMQDNKISDLTRRYFRRFMRTHEDRKTFNFRALTGSFYFILSVLICLILFDKPTVMTAVLIMILSDTAAALIGKSIGRHVIIGTSKTIEGSSAFFIVTVLILFLMHPAITILWAGAIAGILTIVELWSHKLRINDNLSITLAAGALLTVLPF